MYMHLFIDTCIKHGNGNEAIYRGALITCAQSILMMVAFLLKHNLTDAALNDLLNMLNLFLPNTF